MFDKLTKSDIAKMEEEIEHRKLVVRPKALEDVKEARAQGDLSENFEYYAAKKFNNQVINNAKSFAIQTSKGGSYRDAYGRLLGYVWYSNLSNPSPSDYMCLNFEMVREAYAFTYFDEVTNNRYTMFYKSVAYTNIMRNAELRAKNNGWKIHGETDPDFHY